MNQEFMEIEPEVDASHRPAWVRVGEGLVSGIHHALNNRMAALRAVGQVLETDLPAAHPLSGALSAELERLERSARTLSLLGAHEVGLIPTQIDDAVGDAKTLFTMHHSVRDIPLEVEKQDNLLPVLIDPAPILRGTTLALVMVARSGGGVLLKVEGDATAVRLHAIPTHSDTATEDEPIANLELADVEREVAAGGGTARRKDDGGIEIEVLTLPEARRREREG